MWEDKLFAWADTEIGPIVDLYRGLIPRSVGVVEFALETGIDEYCIASDKVLTECGVAGVELVRYLKANADPFDREASIWFGLKDLISDAMAYINGDERRRIPAIGQRSLDDIWYLCFLDFSIGTPAVRHILKVVGAQPNPGLEPWRIRILAWSESPDFNEARHAAYWGRQSPGLVQKRIRKQLDRLRWAQTLGPTSGADYKMGPVPPEDRPLCEPTFPETIRKLAERKAKLPFTSNDPAEKKRLLAEHAEIHDAVKGYRNRRRRADAKYVPWKIRLSRWIRGVETRNREGRERTSFISG